MDVSRKITRKEFDRLYPKLSARFRALGASAEETEDLVQEALIRASESLSSFQERSTLDTWVVSIAKKVWLNYRRSHRAEKRRTTRISIEGSPEIRDQLQCRVDLEDQFLTRDLLDRVDRSIRGLPDSMQKALVLYCKGHKYREISTQIGIPENRVASLIHQARTKLRQNFIAKGSRHE